MVFIIIIIIANFNYFTLFSFLLSHASTFTFHGKDNDNYIYSNTSSCRWYISVYIKLTQKFIIIVSVLL